MLFWIIAIIFIFLQSVGLPVDGVTWLALWGLVVWPAKKAWLTVFGLGLVFDIVQGQTWGELSLVYLGIGMALWLYRKKYYPYHLVFLWLFFSGSSLLVFWLTSLGLPMFLQTSLLLQTSAQAGGAATSNLTAWWGDGFVWIQAGLAGLLAVALRGRMVENQQMAGGLRLKY